jgi:hypothetical protein
LVLAIGPQSIRIVTHLDVNESQVREAGRILQEVAEEYACGTPAPITEPLVAGY